MDHDTYQSLPSTAPSGTPPLQCPTPCPSKASETSLSFPVLPLLLLKKNNITDTISLMNMDCPNVSWKHLLAPTKKNGRFELAEESEMRCQEIGLVAFMFFFELLFSYVSFAISFYVPLANLFSIILFLIC